MKRVISALLDNELEQTETDHVFDELWRDVELRQTWFVYHMIGDTLRQTHACSCDLSVRVMDELEEEPIVLVPARIKQQSKFTRIAKPLAAAVMGAAAVGWVALSLNGSTPIRLAQRTLPSDEVALNPGQSESQNNLQEYVLAHQAHTHGYGIQGIAPYVRSVSEIRQSERP